MVKGFTLQEYVNLLQSQIDSGKIDGSTPVAVCSYTNPREEYWLLDPKFTKVEKYGDIAIVTY